MRLVGLVAIAILFASTVARAETVTVGLFAPSAPFPSTAARVELANKLGDHLGKALGSSGSGRNYARAGDYSSAVKKGDITIAVVDASYLAVAGGNYTVLAGAVRNGDTSPAWQLVARGTDSISALRGKRVLVPSLGGRESDFVINVLFGGDVAKDYFGKIEAAPDTASTLAALGLGKAVASAMEATARQPEASGKILVNMMAGCALIEALTIYALVAFFLLQGKIA